MTAHCIPEKQPDDMMEAAADLWLLAHDPSDSIMENIRRMADYLTTKFQLPSVVPLHADGSPPGVGVSLTPRTAPGGEL
jgi:hypothetical protein